MLNIYAVAAMLTLQELSIIQIPKMSGDKQARMDCVHIFCLCLHVVCIHTSVCACVGMRFSIHRHERNR